MTTITILPEKSDSYRAVAGDKESTGRTAGEALDALTSQLEDEESGTLVIVQNYKPDQFFNAAQQERLTELMQLHKADKLSPEEENELESLVEAELNGAQQRVEQKLQRGKEVTSEALSEALSTGRPLTPQEWNLLFLSVVKDFSSKEIAAIIDMDEPKTLYELQRVRAKIRSRLKKIIRRSKVSDDSA